MTRQEFGAAIHYLGSGLSTQLSADSLEVYYDCLSDLDPDLFRATAKRMLMHHKWHRFPTIAEIREEYRLAARNEVSAITPSQAWDIAWRVACNTDPELDGHYERTVKKLDVPPIVLAAINRFGVLNLCYDKGPIGILRAQFTAVFDQVSAQAQRSAVMQDRLKAPAKEPIKDSVKAIVDAIGNPTHME